MKHEPGLFEAIEPYGLGQVGADMVPPVQRATDGTDDPSALAGSNAVGAPFESESERSLRVRTQREDAEQFRLHRMQVFNWGTFDGLHTIDVSPKGMLFIGPSGSGKSTLLDAHASLLTPPRWLNFNVAARESEQKADRTVLTYLRGVWGEQTQASGEIADQQLRKGSTWAAISECYRNAAGQTVTVAHVYWIRGSSNSPREVGKRYLVVDRALELTELKFFPESDYDVKRFKRELEGIFVTDAFSEYQERFRARLGVETEHALKLLHKTQSAKNLGSLTQFLRDFMLDESQAKSMALELVAQFQKLDSAHTEVIKAELQSHCLMRSRVARQAIDALDLQSNWLKEVIAGIGSYRDGLHATLLRRAIEGLNNQLVGQRALKATRRLNRDQCHSALEILNEQLNDKGGGRLKELQASRKTADELRAARQKRKDAAQKACKGLGVSLPSNARSFEEMRNELQAEIEFSVRDAGDSKERRDLAYEEGSLVKQIESTQAELVELQQAPTSNIDGPLLAMRRRIADASGCRVDQIPFAGELIEVRASEHDWQGAIERVLRGFALTVLVPEDLYIAVADAVDSVHLGGRLVYLRCLPRQHDDVRLDPRSVAAKVLVGSGPFQRWVQDELRSRFDVICVPTAAQLREHSAAVTRAGQMQRGRRLHEKDDSYRVNDPRRWVLGANTEAKSQRLLDSLEALNGQLAKVRERLLTFEAAERLARERIVYGQNIVGLAWLDIDVEASVLEVAGLDRLIEDLLKDATVAQLQARVGEAELALEKAQKDLGAQETQVARTLFHLEGLSSRLGKLEELPTVNCTPTQVSGIETAMDALRKEPTLETYADDIRAVERHLEQKRSEVAKDRDLRVRDIIEAFRDFIRQWPTDADGLDATMQSYEDFSAKLERLEKEDLPSTRQKFLALLEEHSNQHSAFLLDRIKSDREEVLLRMEAVNHSLRSAQYNPGSYLRIEVEDRIPEDARRFQEDLTKALAQTAGVGNPASAEERFAALKAIIQRLGSQSDADLAWRERVLDVRLHVEFVARELEVGTDREIEVYRSGGGKSGGQRQKLTATCLAAALRYQLGGPERIRSSFATVILDEAFDKADADFTEAAIRVFKMFGFQLIIATPVKSVMTIEPFVGGAVYIHIQGGKKSNLMQLPYDEVGQRIDLDAAGVETSSDGTI
ncbi:hypothetical protein BKP43_47630 [Variovorax boronicumulans]|uniref:ATP-binding protein n=1 Tax=Variovorax boronicumulans TaxID=436515 RepID=UPI000BB31B8F|nr:ATP-binding protein [Variovorax boronicumulans]PBI85491.1 hypothetical protein BKP43_47630 [Variovorax boronicumulans]